MMRRKDKVVLRSCIPRGGFECPNVAAPVVSATLTGRGSTAHESNNVKFEPPMKAQETSKPKLMKNGMYAMIKKQQKSSVSGAPDLPYDENFNINWDYLESRRKRKPCQKAIKHISKNIA